MCVCVSWWHWLAKASRCSGFLSGPIRSALELACCRCVRLPRRGNQTSDSEPSLVLNWLSFINMKHCCTGRNRSAPLQRWCTSPKRSSVVIIFFFKKVIYSLAQNAAALAERGWVELLCSTAEQEFRVWLQMMRRVLSWTPWYATAAPRTERGEEELQIVRGGCLKSYCFFAALHILGRARRQLAERNTRFKAVSKSLRLTESILLLWFTAKQTVWPKVVFQMSIKQVIWGLWREVSVCETRV